MVIISMFTVLGIAASVGYLVNKLSIANNSDPLMVDKNKPSLIPPEKIWCGYADADIFSAMMDGYKKTEVLWDNITGDALLRTVDYRDYTVSVRIKPVELKELMSLGFNTNGHRFDGAPVLSALVTILSERTGIRVQFEEATGEGQGFSEKEASGVFLLLNLNR